jgi:aspartyl protease
MRRIGQTRRMILVPAVCMAGLASVAPGAEVTRSAPPDRGYTLKLTPHYRGPGPMAGVYIRASIGGSRPLRLLLDTGAKNIVLTAKAAEKLDLEYLADSALAGFGGGAQTAAGVFLARSIRFGDLELANCRIEVAQGPLPLELDGVVGPVVFEQFLVRINAGRQTLELEPLDAPVRGHAAPHTLLVRAVLAGAGSGYFLLDTGAAMSLVSDRLRRAVGPLLDRPSFSLRGASGAMPGRMIHAVEFLTGGQRLVDREVAVADLSALSLREGMEVSGVIGFRALSQTVVTIDYRNRQVWLGAGERLLAAQR